MSQQRLLHSGQESGLGIGQQGILHAHPESRSADRSIDVRIQIRQRVEVSLRVSEKLIHTLPDLLPQPPQRLPELIAECPPDLAFGQDSIGQRPDLGARPVQNEAFLKAGFSHLRVESPTLP
jgi:hypothetical protein